MSGLPIVVARERRTNGYGSKPYYVYVATLGDLREEAPTRIEALEKLNATIMRSITYQPPVTVFAANGSAFTAYADRSSYGYTITHPDGRGSSCGTGDTFAEALASAKRAAEAYAEAFA